jgi:Na+-translocating ferredoxin:NAD+ oxidoreductase RnfG subunit
MKCTGIQSQLLLGTVLVALFESSLLFAEVFKTRDDALATAFEGAGTVLRKTVFLTDEQVSQIESLAKVAVESKIVTYYIGMKSDSAIGFAFFETNVVRTKSETFLVVVRPDGSVQKTEMLAFYEPMDYMPTSNWFTLFRNRVLSDGLWPKREIHNVTGATLTVRAVTQGVRKILATFDVAVRKER